MDDLHLEYAHAKADFIYGTYSALPLGFLLSKQQHTLHIASIRRIQRYTVEEIAPLLLLQNPSKIFCHYSETR